MKRRNLCRFGLFFLLFSVLGFEIDAVPVWAKEYHIAVVKDGPSWEDGKLSDIEAEINHMLGSADRVVFDLSEKFDAKWQKDRYRKVIENALKDRKIDMILGLGVLVLQEAAQSDFKLTKPFISATLLNGDIPKLEYSKDDYSLKNNLVVMIQPQDAKRDLQVFHGIWKFERLHVLMGREIYNNLADLKAAFNDFKKKYGTEVIAVPIEAETDNFFDERLSDMQAAYLMRIPRLSVEKRKSLIEELTRRKIPTFSALGSKDLELGAFATNRPDVSNEVIRRTALNIFNIIEGASTKSLPVFLISDPHLQINAKTAVALGYQPNYEARVSVTFLHPEAFREKEKPLYIKDVIKMAKDGNKDLFISQAKTDAAASAKGVARSPMLPQIGLDGSYNYYDMPAVGVIVPEQWLQLKLRLRQMIYNDRIISDYRTSDRRSQAAQYYNESTNLDVYKQAEYYFLLYTQARLIHQIQLANLRLTEGNLDIAKMRVDVGHAGQDEVYRWQAELARRKVNVLQAEAIVEKQRIALNQILGVDQSIRWLPEQINADMDSFIWLNASFAKVFETTESVNKFTEAMVKYGLQSSPEINAIAKEKEAQEITLGQRKRSYYLPSVSAELSYGNNLHQYPDEPDFGKKRVTAGVTASLPLLEGTGRYYDVQRQKARLNELNFQLLKTQELVEKRVRTAVRNLESSFPNIRFSSEAAKNARLNFEVVREKYANGIVSITDLLEAQTASFKADLEVVSAKYTFWADLVELQRAVSFFPEAKSSEEIQSFIETIKSEMEE